MQANNYFAYINGEFKTYDKASLPIGDRGLKFGDGVYETIRVENGKIFSWKKHIGRLNTSLSLLKIRASLDNLEAKCIELVSKNNISEGTLRIMITRGVGGIGYLPDSKENCGIIVEALPLPNITKEPVNLWLSTLNKIPPTCLPPAAKTMQGLSSTLARMEAGENNCFEALLLSTSGHICECSSSNIFWAKDGKLYTPSLESGILAGTTRDSIIELWPEKVLEGIYSLEELESADEVFVTNVVWTALPVAKLMPQGIEFKSNEFCIKARELLAQEMAIAI